MHGQVTSYSLQMFLLFVLLVCSFNGVVSKSCCGDPGCGESCPWSDSCSDGTDTACMDRIAGPFKCRDKSLCNTIEECDEEEAAYRAGNLCHNFPWYNGGYPIDKIQ